MFDDQDCIPRPVNVECDGEMEELNMMAGSSPETSASVTTQEQAWQGGFGKDYSERNYLTPVELDALYEKRYGVGITRTALNSRLLTDVPRNANVLEVGSNLGNQLLMLQQMGFTNLTGIEINGEIVRESQVRLPSATLAEGSALQIPYPEARFDLVFTSGLLIHIAPEDLTTAMSEIHRCSKTWIWGAEYYAPEMREVPYRGHRNLLWKTDYAKLYLENFPDLELVLEQRLPYLQDSNIDTMFLLRRK